MDTGVVLLLVLLLVLGLVLIMFYVFDINLQLVTGEEEEDSTKYASDDHHHNGEYDTLGKVTSHNSSMYAHQGLLDTKLNTSVYNAHVSSSDPHPGLLAKLNTSVYNAHVSSSDPHPGLLDKKLNTSVYNAHVSSSDPHPEQEKKQLQNFKDFLSHDDVMDFYNNHTHGTDGKVDQNKLVKFDDTNWNSMMNSIINGMDVE